MKFENVNESFNYWNKRSKSEILTRSAEIKGLIDNDPEADVMALNIEIDGINQVLANKAEKEQAQEETEQTQERGLNPITGINFDTVQAENPENVLDTKIYRNAFFKNLLGRDMSLKEKAIFRQAQEEFRANEFNSSTNSSAILPTETLNEVISKARQEGGLMSVARAFSIPSNIAIPIGNPQDKAVWNTEGQEVESEKASVETVKFDGYEIIKVFSISNKVKTMSIPAFESYLTDELSNCVMATLADGLVTGTGKNQGTGLISGITWTRTNSFNTVSDFVEYTDITRMVSMLKRGYSNGAYFIMNNATLYQYVYGIVDSNKRPIFVIDPKNESIGMLLGFPVVIDDFIPDNTIIFGNPQYIGYNLPQGIAVESSTQSSFRSGKVDYRAMAIADCKPIIKEAFIKLNIRTSAEIYTDLTLSESTQPETVEGVSATITVNKNVATIKYKGLKDQPIAYQLLTSKNAVIAEMPGVFTTTKTSNTITLLFDTDMPEDTYTLNAKVIDESKYKTVEQVKLTIKQNKDKINKVNGSPIVIGAY